VSDVSASVEQIRNELAKRVDAVEAGYELMLAYAAQGMPSDAQSANGAQLREFLERFDHALTGLADLYQRLITESGLDTTTYAAFLKVLARDAESAQAGIRVVRAQASISSQLVDNLNASIHVRALLTDVFLIDEALKDAPR
jgi:hypothetical protein